MQKNIKIIALIIVSFQFFSTPAEGKLNYYEVEKLFAEDRLQDAEDILNREAKGNDKDPVVLSLLGEFYRKRGDRGRAARFLNQAAAMDPKYPISYFYRGKLFFSMQKFDEAMDDFDLFMKNMPPELKGAEEKDFYISKLYEVSHICFSLKRYPEAKKAIDEILNIDPHDQAAIYNMGIYYYTYERKRPVAYKYFSMAIEISPNTQRAAKARYAIEFMRANPDPRIEPDFDFIDQEYRN